MFKVFLTISTKDYFRTINFFFNGEGRGSFPIRERRHLLLLPAGLQPSAEISLNSGESHIDHQLL